MRLSADLAIINANVRTMNPNQHFAQAVAIKRNRIILVGTNQEINNVVGEKTKVINLDGKTVIPGLIDTHIHVADFGRCLLWLDLTSADSIENLKRLVSEKAKQTPAGQMDYRSRLERNPFQRKTPAQSIRPKHRLHPTTPYILYREAAMICAANGKAITLAGVTSKRLCPKAEPLTKTLDGRAYRHLSGHRHQPNLASRSRTNRR